MKTILKRTVLGLLLASMAGQIFAAEMGNKPKKAGLAKKEADQMKKAIQASKVQAQNEANLSKALQASEEEANMRKAMADSLADEVRLKEKHAQEARLKAEAEQRAQAKAEKLRREAQAKARAQAARQAEAARVEKERAQAETARIERERAQAEAARVERERVQAEAARRAEARAEAVWQARVARMARERIQAEAARIEGELAQAAQARVARIERERVHAEEEARVRAEIARQQENIRLQAQLDAARIERERVRAQAQEEEEVRLAVEAIDAATAREAALRAAQDQQRAQAAARQAAEAARLEGERKDEAVRQARATLRERNNARQQRAAAEESQRIIEGSRQFQLQVQERCTQAQTGIETARRNVQEAERLLAQEVQQVQVETRQAEQARVAAERRKTQARFDQQAQQARNAGPQAYAQFEARIARKAQARQQAQAQWVVAVEARERAHAVDPAEEKEAELKIAASAPCGNCFNEVNKPFKLKCGHSHCTDCLTEQIDNVIKEQKTDALRCSGCGAHISFDDVARLTENNRTKLDLLARIIFREQPNVKQCPTRDCEHLFVSDPANPRIDMCPECDHEYCVSCVAHHAAGVTCQEAEAQAQQAKTREEQQADEWKRQNTKPCPRCHKDIEKDEGCLHMQCPAPCGGKDAAGKDQPYHFCWACLGPYDPPAHGEQDPTRHGSYYCPRHPNAYRDEQAQIQARREREQAERERERAALLERQALEGEDGEILRQIEEIEAATRRQEAAAVRRAQQAQVNRIRQAELRVRTAATELRAREAYLVTLQVEQRVYEQEAGVDADFANRLANAGKDGGAFEQYLVNYIQQHNRFPDSMNRAYAKTILNVGADNYAIAIAAFESWLSRYPTGNLSPHLIMVARAYLAGLIGRYGVHGVSAVIRDEVYERELTARINNALNNGFNGEQLFMDGRSRANGPFEHDRVGPNEYLDAMARGVIRPGLDWFINDSWGRLLLGNLILRNSVEEIVVQINNKPDGARIDWRNFIVAMRQAMLRQNDPRVDLLSLLVEALNRPQQQRRN